MFSTFVVLLKDLEAMHKTTFHFILIAEYIQNTDAQANAKISNFERDLLNKKNIVKCHACKHLDEHS